MLLHDPVSSRLLDGRLGLGMVVAGLDDEQDRVLAHAGVRVGGDLKPFRAAPGAALAHDRHPLRGHREGLADRAHLLVEAAEDRLVLPDPALTLVHRRLSAADRARRRSPPPPRPSPPPSSARTPPPLAPSPAPCARARAR